MFFRNTQNSSSAALKHKIVVHITRPWVVHMRAAIDTVQAGKVAQEQQRRRGAVAG